MINLFVYIYIYIFLLIYFCISAYTLAVQT